VSRNDSRCCPWAAGEHIFEAAAGEPAARDLGADAAFIARGIGKIDKIVLGETRMERDIH
jgi:hypothetical protein